MSYMEFYDRVRAIHDNPDFDEIDRDLGVSEVLEFIPGSISNVYKDTDGNACSLFHLVNESPEWACSRIREGEKAAAQLAELRAAYVSAAIDNIAASDDGEWLWVPRWFLSKLDATLPPEEQADESKLEEKGK